MTIAHHRAPTAYATPTALAAVLAVAIGLVVGVGIALALFPDMNGFLTGVTYGLILGVPAAVAVVFARRAVEHGAALWAVASVSVACVVIAAALLFALTQVDVRLAPLGALLGIVTGAVSLYLGLRLTRQRRGRESAPLHRRE